MVSEAWWLTNRARCSWSAVWIDLSNSIYQGSLPNLDFEWKHFGEMNFMFHFTLPTCLIAFHSAIKSFQRTFRKFLFNAKFTLRILNCKFYLTCEVHILWCSYRRALWENEPIAIWEQCSCIRLLCIRLLYIPQSAAGLANFCSLFFEVKMFE